MSHISVLRTKQDKKPHPMERVNSLYSKQLEHVFTLQSHTSTNPFKSCKIIRQLALNVHSFMHICCRALCIHIPARKNSNYLKNNIMQRKIGNVVLRRFYACQKRFQAYFSRKSKHFSNHNDELQRNEKNPNLLVNKEARNRQHRNSKSYCNSAFPKSKSKI